MLCLIIDRLVTVHWLDIVIKFEVIAMLNSRWILIVKYFNNKKVLILQWVYDKHSVLHSSGIHFEMLMLISNICWYTLRQRI